MGKKVEMLQERLPAAIVSDVSRLEAASAQDPYRTWNVPIANRMFLIAGIQPKTRRVDDNPQRCPACGLNRAYATRVDHYLSLFFIPLLRVKRGETFLFCDNCGQPAHGFRAPTPQVPPAGTDTVCVACGRSFDRSYKYCPHCGQRA